jgi:hypothetical protein
MVSDNKKPKNVIAFIAYGAKNADQAVFSISSLIEFLKYETKFEYAVKVFTNHPEKFEFLKNYVAIHIEELSEDFVNNSIYPENYFPKLKILLMNRLLELGENNKLALLDSDTFFIGNPEILFDKLEGNKLLLHLFEWEFKDGRNKNPVLCPVDGEITLSSGRKVTWDGRSKMYNVGIIGINKLQKQLISDSLEFIGKYYSLYPSWHVEQLCVSLIFQQEGKIQFGHRQVYHYWHGKEIFQKNTVGFYKLIDAGAYDEALTQIHQIKKRIIFKIESKNFYLRMKSCIRELPGIYSIYKMAFKQGRR